LCSFLHFAGDMPRSYAGRPISFCFDLESQLFFLFTSPEGSYHSFERTVSGSYMFSRPFFSLASTLSKL
jgi:hypothetical protein